MPNPTSISTVFPFPASPATARRPIPTARSGHQYVQIVNEGFQVFNKTTGASVLGPSASTRSGPASAALRDHRPATRSCSTTTRRPLGHHPVRRRRSRPTSASPSRPRAMPPARIIATASTSAPTSSTIRTGRLARCLLHEHERLQFVGHRVPRPAAVRLRPREDARRLPGHVRHPGHHRRVNRGTTCPPTSMASTLPPAGAPDSFVELPGAPSRTGSSTSTSTSPPRLTRRSLCSQLRPRRVSRSSARPLAPAYRSWARQRTWTPSATARCSGSPIGTSARTRRW